MSAPVAAIQIARVHAGTSVAKMTPSQMAERPSQSHGNARKPLGPAGSSPLRVLVSVVRVMSVLCLVGLVRGDRNDLEVYRCEVGQDAVEVGGVADVTDEAGHDVR